MFLKTLTLKGFKSFADTTTLELEPGVTVVVGPNGSGKSNVVDAVAWALGAQGPRTVRSGKMEDVVFAGTADRPALGRAEVSLTIDNGSGAAAHRRQRGHHHPHPLPDGESEYAINGVACRLLDVQELLSDSGVGRTQHVIVGQGQLDAVLDARPEDRRAVIEEAAGILKYRRRKERAERRLAATEADLLRLGDLLREVRRTLRPLERQAEAARRHEDLAAELSALRLHLAGKELAVPGRPPLGQRHHHRRRGRGGRRPPGRAGPARRGGRGRLRRARHRGRRPRRRPRPGRAAAGAGPGPGRRARGAPAGPGAGPGAAVDAAVVATLEADAARLVAELAEQEEAVAGLGPDRERLAEDEAVVAAERASLPHPEEPAEARAAEARGDLAAARAAADAATSAAEATVRQRALEAKATRLADEATTLRAGVEAAAGEVPARRADQASAAFEHDRAEAAAAEADGTRRTAEAEHATWRARAEALAAAVDETRARAGLERVSAIEGVLGTLVDLVEVDPGWERAFAAAVAPALSAVVVDGPDAARRPRGAAGTEGAAAAVLPSPSPRVPALAAPGSRCAPTCGPGGPRWAPPSTRCWAAPSGSIPCPPPSTWPPGPPGGRGDGGGRPAGARRLDPRFRRQRGHCRRRRRRRPPGRRGRCHPRGRRGTGCSRGRGGSHRRRRRGRRHPGGRRGRGPPPQRPGRARAGGGRSGRGPGRGGRAGGAGASWRPGRRPSGPG